MLKSLGFYAIVAFAVGGFLPTTASVAQTPEQQKMWDAQRAQALVDEKAQAGKLAQERAQRQANPMAWVATLNPMTAGGWEFRGVASDGSWAAYTSTHQLKRSGKTVTVWLRQEYAEPQTGADNRFLSLVEKAQYDCGKQRERPLLVIYYTSNNIQGNAQTDEADAKTAPWNSIVPGTRDEFNFLWACGVDKVTPHG